MYDVDKIIIPMTAKDTLGEDAVVIDETNAVPAEEPVDNATEVAETDELATVDEIPTVTEVEETPAETNADPYAGGSHDGTPYLLKSPLRKGVCE